MTKTFYRPFTMIKIENFTVNIHKMTIEQDDDNELLESQIPAVVRDELLSAD